MATQLTAKQLAFARLVADGVSKTDALLLAYPNTGRSRATARVEGSRLSHHPKIAHEIHRLVCARFPQTLDVPALLEEAVATMAKLSRTGSPGTRFRATMWLLDHGQKLLQNETVGNGPEKITTALRSLYVQGLRRSRAELSSGE
jgi:hypothetical protein